MTAEWFRPRGYRHFDAQIGPPFAERISQVQIVERHSWLPLIYYESGSNVTSGRSAKPPSNRGQLCTRPIAILASYRSMLGSCLAT
jgi:RNA-directed DNA polymerase